MFLKYFPILLFSLNIIASEILISPKSQFLIFNQHSEYSIAANVTLIEGSNKKQAKMKLRGDLPKHRDRNYPSFQLVIADKNKIYKKHVDFMRADDKYFFIEQIPNFLEEYYKEYLPISSLKEININGQRNLYLKRSSINKALLSKNFDKESSFFKLRHFFKKKIKGEFTFYRPLLADTSITNKSYLKDLWYVNLGNKKNTIKFKEFTSKVLSNPLNSKLSLKHYSMHIALMLYTGSMHSLEADNLIWYYSYGNDLFMPFPKDLHLRRYRSNIYTRLNLIKERDVILRNLLKTDIFKKHLNDSLAEVKRTSKRILNHINKIEIEFPQLINNPEYTYVKNIYLENQKEFQHDFVIK